MNILPNLNNCKVYSQSFRGNGYPPLSPRRTPINCEFVRIKNAVHMSSATNLPNKRFDAAGTAIDLVKGDFTDHLAAVIPIEIQSINASGNVADGGLTFAAS